MSLRPVPKPVSTKTTKGKHQNSTSAVFTCKTNGEWGEEIAFTNLLNLGIEEGIVDSFLAEGGHGRGDGAICRTCNGTGALEREVKEFKQRRMRADIQTVRWPVRMEDQIEKMPSVTYQEFLAGKLPSKNE